MPRPFLVSPHAKQVEKPSFSFDSEQNLELKTKVLDHMKQAKRHLYQRNFLQAALALHDLEPETSDSESSDPELEAIQLRITEPKMQMHYFLIKAQLQKNTNNPYFATQDAKKVTALSAQLNEPKQAIQAQKLLKGVDVRKALIFEFDSHIQNELKPEAVFFNTASDQTGMKRRSSVSEEQQPTLKRMKMITCQG